MDPLALSAKQSEDLAGQRNTLTSSRDMRDSEHLNLQYAQSGIPYVSEHSAYVTIKLKPDSAIDLASLQKLASYCLQASFATNFLWIATLAVSFPLWRKLHPGQDEDLDILFAGEDALHDVLANHQPPYALTGGDLFLQIQSRTAETVRAVAKQLIAEIAQYADIAQSDCTIGDSIHGGRVYGGRLLHGLIGSVDPVGFSARAIIGDELPDHKGGCFCLTQRFQHNWDLLGGMADMDIENLIGRDHSGNMLLNDDERSHVRLARVNDPDGVNYRLVGQSEPYREDPDSTGGHGREAGVFQLSYAKSTEAITSILNSLAGDKPGFIKSRHFQVSHANLGSYWYVPSAKELALASPHKTLSVPMNAFFAVRSKNGRMYYNSKDYLHRAGNHLNDANFDPPLTDRVIELLGYTFSRWHDTWYHRRPQFELGHLKDYIGKARWDEALNKSLAERKGMAVRETLKLLSTHEAPAGNGLGEKFDTYRLHPRELIVGVVPDWTLGSGVEAIGYFTEQECISGYLMQLNAAAAAGHNVPYYQRALDWGLGQLMETAKNCRDTAQTAEQKQFYESVVLSLQGVQAYMLNYADLAQEKLKNTPKSCVRDRENLTAIHNRMTRLASERPQSFQDALQLVFSLHCCMHIAGETVSIGRLDQLIAPYLAADHITPEAAQELVDCFWIKMDEKVLLNRRYTADRLSRGSGAITYAGGDYPQGAALNQWVQQVTVGGYIANDDPVPQDACNAVTRMCLRAARRLPFNAPCLSLRVHHSTPQDVIEEAAYSLLSGGAHPLLINDDKIVSGLLHSGEGIKPHTSIVPLHDARDMVCDGCFEPLVGGKSEFAFSFVPVPDAVEMALNRGRTYAAAGPVHLTGLKASYRSKAPQDIQSWDEFYQIFLSHYRFKLIDFFNGMYGRYGNLNKICPSPLLSLLIDGCIESGRDLTAGGARYKILAPLLNGITCAIDSLWAIKDMVFSPDAVFTLPELATCLICDWGYDMKEPFFSSTAGEDRIAVEAERYHHLRNYALHLPKLGQGNEAVDAFARAVINDLLGLVNELARSPDSPVNGALEALRKKYGTPDYPFDFVITPGIATFEDNGGIGSFLGASADGRRSGDFVASDISPSPVPTDLPPHEKGLPASVCLKSWAGTGDSIHEDPIGVGLSNGSPVDINIRENFPPDQLIRLISDFAKGRIGSNMLSITCADLKTMSAAQQNPECYDLLRNRMGGWSEFFVAIFPKHQEHHKRRPFFEADRPQASSLQATPWAAEKQTR